MVAGCSRAPVITISNQSSVTLSNLVVSGSGFSARVGEIAAGRQRKLTVRPSGESGVRVVFDAGSQHIDTGEQDYFEAGGGYRVAVTVHPDLKVSVSSNLRGYWRDPDAYRRRVSHHQSVRRRAGGRTDLAGWFHPCSGLPPTASVAHVGLLGGVKAFTVAELAAIVSRRQRTK